VHLAQTYRFTMNRPNGPNSANTSQDRKGISIRHSLSQSAPFSNSPVAFSL
jgi:hypothetical protein